MSSVSDAKNASPADIPSNASTTPRSPRRLKELALERRRFGYRRLHIMLRREAYREARLTVRQ